MSLARRTAVLIRKLQWPYLVYCCQAWQKAAAMTILRIPVTCPPITWETFNPRWMEGKRVLYFKLHGYPDRPHWDGIDNQGNRVKALTPNLVAQANLAGAIVIAVVCYGAGGEMEKAFMKAGASAFFGSVDEVRARETECEEADRLAKNLLTILGKGRQAREGPRALPGALAQAREMYQAQVLSWTEHDQFTLETFGGTYALQNS